MSMSDSDKTAKLYRLLAKRFDPPAWALIHEVANCTGYGARRHADAIAISLWPSRGLAIHGIEVKASRTDWLRELKKPDKSEPIQRYCDHWWIVAWKGVVENGELPPTWGLLEPQGQRGLVAKVDAPKLEPMALDVGFAAAIGRRMGEAIDAAKAAAYEQLKAEQTEKADDSEYQRGVADAAPMMVRVKRAHEQLLERIQEFESASGVSINTWQGGDIGEAVRVIQHQRISLVDIMAHQIRVLGNALERAKETQKALKPFLGDRDNAPR